MLGKLLKYEFRATGRIFLPMFGALIVMSLLTIPLSLLAEKFGDIQGAVGFLASAPYVICMIIASALTGIVGIVAFIIMIQRFNKNLLGDEGYLMFTLPAKTDGLIFSKLITCIAWFFASTIVSSIGVMLISKESIFDAIANFGRVISGAFTNGGAYFVQCLLVVLLVLIALAGGVLAVYMCISLAMRFNRRRGLMAVCIFMLYMIVLVVLFVLGVFLLSSILNAEMFSNLFWNMSMDTASILTLSVVTVILAALGAAEYFITRYMLKNKLNLE